MPLDVRLRAYLPNGASQGLLPVPGDWDLTAPLNDIPALKLDYAVDAARSDLLGQPLEIAAEVSGDGGQTWVEPPGCRFLYLRDGRDPLKRGDSWQVEAPGYLWLLKKAKVAYNDADGYPGYRTWATPVTPGRIATVFFYEAKNLRGGLAGVNQTWTDTNDSAGVPWPETLLRQYAAGIDLLQVLMDLSEAGLIDFQTTGRDLQLYVPERGVDRTVGDSQVTLSAISSPAAPFRRTWEGIAGTIMGLGDGGAYEEFTNPGASQPWGRWEEYVTYGGVTDSGTLQSLIQTQAELTAGPRLEFTQELETAQGPRPHIDFGVGDYVWSRSLSGARDRYRVRQITLSAKGGSIGGNVVLNDRFLESDIRLQRRLQALSGGASVAGSTGTPPGADILPPAAPTGVTVTSSFYMDGGGVPHAQVTVDWLDVNTNMDGSPATDVDRYEVWTKESGSGAWRVAGETPAGTSVAFLSPYPPGTTWDFRVRAIDNAGNLSAFSSTSSVLTAQDSTPPAVPKKPTASSANGFIQVNWDGLNAAGNPQNEPDLFRVEVHIGTTAGFTPTPGSSATMVGSFTGPGKVAIPGYAVGTTYYVKLVAVDSSLNASAASAGQSVTVVSGASDGNVPVTTGWTVDLRPLGLMALSVTWQALANADALTYRVYAHTSSPVPIDSAHLVGITGGTSLTFGSIAGVLLDPTANYYVAVVPSDADGSATSYPTVGPQKVRQAGDGSVSESWTYVGPISATQLVTGDLAANIAIIGELATAGSGRRVSMSSADGFKAVNPNGDTVAQIPTDSTRDISFQMDLVAKSVTALGSVAMRAADNELAQASALILRSATAAPVTPPTLTIEWETVAPNLGFRQPNEYAGGGYNAAANRYYRSWGAWGYAGVEEVDSSGNVTGSFDIGIGPSGPAAVYGCYRDGANIYALVWRPGAGAGGQWTVRKYRWSDKAFLSEWVLANDPAQYVSAYPNGAPTICRGNNGKLVLVYSDATNSNRVRRVGMDPDTGSISESDVSDITFVGAITWAYEGAADTGVNRLWWGSTQGTPAIGGPNRAIAHVVTPNSSFAHDGTRSFPLAADSAWVAYDSTLGRFIGQSRVDGSLQRYEGQGNVWVGGDTQTWYVSNTWRDNDAGGTGLHETVQGPVAVFSMAKRARLKVTTPPIPVDANNANLDDPNAVSIYVGKVDTARANMWRQAAPATEVRTATITNAVFSNADTLHPNPPSVGNFPNLTPARLASDAADGNGALASIQGDGVVRFGTFNTTTGGLARVGTRVLERTAWTAIPLGAGFSNFGSGFDDAQYCVIDGVCYTRGLVNSATRTTGSVIVTIPAGARRTGIAHITVPMNGAFGIVTSHADGTVQFNTGPTSGWLSLALPPYPVG